MQGKFITLEGCDGCGKSTQIELLRDVLIKRNVDFVFTREPGGTEISERIRSIILDPKCGDMDDYTELMLYIAARRQHTQKFIKECLAKNKLVFCDRYIDSTMAYQGYGRGLDKEAIDFCNRLAMGGVKIDLTVFFDLDPKEAFLRKGGADKTDRLECEESVFYKRVYEGYKEIAKHEDRVVAIDAKGSISEVHDRLMNVLMERGIL